MRTRFSFCLRVISGLTLITGSNAAFAADSSTIPVIVITPSAFAQPRELTSVPVTVIDSETIKNSKASNVSELLRGQAGLHVSDLFGDGSQASIDLRGFGPTAVNNTLILVDGKRLNNSSDQGAPDLTSIAIDDIEQIEIIQGSAGVLYGNQAVGGVINIIRKKITVDKFTATARAGSYRSSRLSASVNKMMGETQLSLSAFADNSDNYRDHNDASKNHVNLRLNHQHDIVSGYIDVKMTDSHILTPGALLESEMEDSRTQSLMFYEDDFFDTRTNALSLGFDLLVDKTKTLNFDLSRRVTDREFIQTFRPSPGSLSTQDRDGKTASVKLVFKPLRNSRLISLVGGLQREQTDYELVSAIGPQAIDQKISNIYVSTDWAISEHSRMQAGMRYSDQKARIENDDFDDSLSVFSLGYIWTREQFNIFARADENYRYPTVEEHSNVPFGQQPGLKTQRGTSMELGAEFVDVKTRYRLTAYTIRLNDEIAFDSSGFSNLNLDKTKRQGVIVELSNDWTQKLSTTLSLTQLDATITDGPFKDNDLPMVPEQTVRIDGFYRISPQLLANLGLISVGKQTFGGDFANQLSHLPSYSVVNVNLAWTITQLTLSLKINNLLDEQYSESGSQYTDFSNYPQTSIHESFFPSPERNYWLTVDYEF